MEHLPYGRQWIDEDDINSVAGVLSSDFITTGPKIKEFEEKLAAKVSAKFAVAFNSGTAALHAAYFAAGLNRENEIITSPITFAATANASLYLGAKPVFVDINYSTGNINPAKIEQAVTGKTKIIAPVHFAGQPVEISEIKAIANKHGLIVVEDAAHALGAAYKKQPIGSISDLTIFSFHPVKNITTGEGGAVATNNPYYYEKLQMFRSHGIVKDQKMVEEIGLWYYQMEVLGYNYRLTDFQAALGLSQLKKLDAFIDKRRWLAAEYNKRLLPLLDFIDLPVVNEDVEPSWHLYTIKVKGGEKERRALFDYLQSRKIGVQVHYIPVYWHPYYQQMGYTRGACPEAERFYRGVISLPMFPKMNEPDVSRVCENIADFFGVALS